MVETQLEKAEFINIEKKHYVSKPTCHCIRIEKSCRFFRPMRLALFFVGGPT